MPDTGGLRVVLVVWAAAVVVVTAVAATAGYDPADSATWSRWDSLLYEDIADDGYQLFRCPPDAGIDGWCGDAGWFPAYPWIVGTLHALGAPLRGSAVVVSWLLAGSTIALVWATFLRRETRSTLIAVLLYAAFAPGQIYSYGVFPLSLLTFAVVLSLWLLYRERWLLAGVAGVVAALAHPLGLLLVPVSVAWIVSDLSVPIRGRMTRVVLTSGVMLAAPGLMALVQRLETGRWNAFLLVQEKYEHGLENPLAAALDALSAPNWPSPGGGIAISIQTAFVLASVGAVAAHALVRRSSLDRLDALVLLWTLVALVFPLTVPTLSLQRAHVVLLPMVVLLARLPKRVLYPLSAVAIPVAVIMEHAFLYGSVV